ncbi:MAG: flagellar export chaperone FliS [Verrucomicrobia bacterium]|nr:flagellar export chaperone FliS [Verrucomicrobiota bacterium]
MKPKNPWQSYRQVATHTASPGQLVLMLYEGAIRFLEHARGGFDIEDPVDSVAAVNNNILRAQEIIRELDFSLNLKEGGELALQLRRLYDYFDRTLTEANQRKEVKGVHEVITRITTLRDAWAAMLKTRGETIDPSMVNTANGRLDFATA